MRICTVLKEGIKVFKIEGEKSAPIIMRLGTVEGEIKLMFPTR